MAGLPVLEKYFIMLFFFVQFQNLLRLENQPGLWMPWLKLSRAKSIAQQPTRKKFWSQL